MKRLWGEDVVIYSCDTDSVNYRYAFGFNNNIIAQYWQFSNKEIAIKTLHKYNFVEVGEDYINTQDDVYFYNPKTSLIYFGHYERRANGDSTFLVVFNTSRIGNGSEYIFRFNK
jgi:hypothetical protein